MKDQVSHPYTTTYKITFLAYFPYFEKTKGGL
jgi:hypothetical protein